MVGERRANSHKFNIEAGWANAEDSEYEQAFVIQAQGRTILCIHAPTARMVLHPDTANAPGYRENDLDHDAAIIEHELGHALRRTLRVGKLGMTPEELGAELYSGKRQDAYLDAHEINLDLELAGGIHIDELLRLSTDTKSPYLFYAELANQAGVATMLEVAFSRPQAYGRPIGPLDRQIQHYLDGYNGIVERYIASQRSKFARADAYRKHRVDQYVRQQIEAGHQRALELHLKHARSALGFGSPIITHDIEESLAKYASTPQGDQ